MPLRVIGAGIGRTGTHSLKLALEQLLGAPCYHMIELFGRPDDVAQFRVAMEGGRADWATVFDGYAAEVDWPASAFYPELMEEYPDAVVLLSTRSDPEAWWRSANETIFPAISRAIDDPPPLEAMVLELVSARFTPDWQQHDAAVEAYEAHNRRVRELVPADRLVEWQPGDGWGPLCGALGVAEPDVAFPHVNTTDEFRRMTGLDAPG